MEHVFHIFGGGCGEHLLIPAIIAAMSGGWAMFHDSQTAKELLGAIQYWGDVIKKAWEFATEPPGLWVVLFLAGILTGVVVGILLFQ